ncbi:hypothetical protein CRG98_022917 [Punica granatum]|uniref:ABC transmembrane type-1 domain-containing protein n=1 Tax=Punica granatum TaxID=22663 RepID=A0A2I0JKA5_PUNGR|nr:hypothetical protein CRG98_022917 [Punica granatum]
MGEEPNQKNINDQEEEEREPKKKNEDRGNSRTSSGSLLTVLKHSDWKDMLLMVLGTLGSVADGLSIALMMIILSNLMNRYGSVSLGLDEQDGFRWAHTAEKQRFQLCRRRCKTASKLGTAPPRIANFIMNMTMFITSQMAAMYLCWRLAVVTVPALIILIIPGLVHGKLLSGVSKKIQQAYDVAEGITEQAFSSIRTVYSYVGEERTATRYRDSLEPTLKVGIKQGVMKGMAMGTMGLTYAVWALQGCMVVPCALGSSLMNVKYFAEANIAAFMSGPKKIQSQSCGLPDSRVETVLFATEYIMFGKEGASMEEITEAAKAANAHNFISQLPDGYITQDPEVLLIDDATSALDSHSGKAVQDALNEASIEWKSTLLGCIGAVAYGTSQPLHAYCIGALVTVYVVDKHKVETQTLPYCFAFLSFAVFSYITNVLQRYFFGIMGENLVKRVREALLNQILTFEVKWFDREENSSGALCLRLATDAVMWFLGSPPTWKLALVATAVQPLMIASFYIRAIVMKTMSKKILKAQNRTSELASEAAANHRMVTAFESQEKVLKLYEFTQLDPKKLSCRQSWVAALGLFMSQFLTSSSAAVLIWYGGKLLYKGELTYKHLFQTFFVLVSTGRVIMETGSITADLLKGTNALKAIFTTLSRKTKMDPNDSDGLNPEKFEGEFEFKQLVALVGHSGSGKSTIIRLIESSMKDGYETYCGERCVQLSGGQKQRISLARAILKNPATLLLDEATSALDSESESLIQDAHSRQDNGWEDLQLVAHRLSTVQMAYKISVIGSGCVLEEGTH